MIKIISWNIQQGGGSRVKGICDVLINADASVLCLNEFKNNEAGYLIRKNLLKAGFLHQFVGSAKPSSNTVLIASKLAFDGSHTSKHDEDFPDAIVKADFSVFAIYNMYLPHKKKHSLFDMVINEMDVCKKGIFVGDFNSGKQFIDQKGNSFMYSDYFDKMEDRGYVDAWRLVHNDEKEYSWYSHQGNGFRYDHNYIHEGLSPIVKDCYYEHSWRMRKLSDHSSMVLVLG